MRPPGVSVERHLNGFDLTATVGSLSTVSSISIGRQWSMESVESTVSVCDALIRGFLHPFPRIVHANDTAIGPVQCPTIAGLLDHAIGIELVVSGDSSRTTLSPTTPLPTITTEDAFTVT